VVQCLAFADYLCVEHCGGLEFGCLFFSCVADASPKFRECGRPLKFAELFLSGCDRLQKRSRNSWRKVVSIYIFRVWPLMVWTARVGFFRGRFRPGAFDGVRAAFGPWGRGRGFTFEHLGF